jgi:NDP-sugar pyrophosphorylase family protein
VKVECIIHAGGQGERLRPLTLELPKPLIPIGLNQKPMIYWSMLPMIKAGIKKFVITANYLSEKVDDYFAGKEWDDFEITVFKEPEKLGRAGSTKFCIEHGLINGKKPLLMHNGADITRNIISDLMKDHENQEKKSGHEVTVVCARKFVVPSSKVVYDPKTKSVISLERKSTQTWPDGESSHVGMFLFGAKYMKNFEKVRIPSDPEDEMMSDMIKSKKAGVFLTDNWIPLKYLSDIDMANKIDIEKFQDSKSEF